MPKLLTLKEVAELLKKSEAAFRTALCRSPIYRSWVVKVGRRTLFRADLIRDWIENGGDV